MADAMDRLDDLLPLWAGRTPDKTALVCGKAELTYGELDRASSALAARLRRAGVCRGDRVGLYMAKGVGAVVGLFGVLKAGAAYVPLDVTGPLSRGLAIIGQCGVKVLLCGLPQLRKLSVSGDKLAGLSLSRMLVLLDKDLPADAPDPDPLPGVEATVNAPLPQLLREETDPPAGDGRTADDTAYILYTSGSTGTPKGVAISHRTSLFFVNWAAEAAGLRAEDRCSNHAPLFFDLSIFDIFAALRSGATTVIIPPAYSAFPRSLANYIEQQRISVWYSVPSTLIDLMAGGDLEGRDLSAMRVVIYAGEAFAVGALRQLFELLPDCTYHNWYGPTETNVCTAFELPGKPGPDEREVSIGRVCQGLDGTLLDADRGVVQGEGEGELAVGGPALMQGYFAMPEETARVMVDLPGHGTVYLTGDLVRRDAEGLLWFVGRKDSMVKVSGYRVEIGEVEAALAADPALAESCVVAVSAEQGKKKLVGYAVVAEGAQTEPEAILAGLQHRIPKYMIPNEIRMLEHIPRTPTGKVDRTSLAAE